MQTMASNASISAKKNTSGVHCIAPGCVNHYYSNKEVHYHRIPSSKASERKWLHVLKRKEVPDRKFARVCSMHFMDSDYEYKSYFDTNGQFVRTKSSYLKPTAYPTVLDFSSYSHKAADCPTPGNTALADSRSQRRARRELFQLHSQVGC